MTGTPLLRGRLADRLSVAPLTLALLTMLCAASVSAQDLWGATPSAAQAAPAKPSAGSSTGAVIGQYIRFQGVGTVFYAGNSGGEVYFAELDEPGVFVWEDALEACGRKGIGWSVPTAPQLALLHRHRDRINLVEKDVRETQAYWYWSSSAVDSEYALRVRAFDGLQQPIKKKFAARVRCVRVY